MEFTSLSGAAKNEHFHVLEWARAQGCPWNKTTSAETGNLILLNEVLPMGSSGMRRCGKVRPLENLPHVPLRQSAELGHYSKTWNVDNRLT
jgi:hypothetical protein